MIDKLQTYLINFFHFDPKHPIILTQIDFWIFFTVVYGIFTVIHKNYTIKDLFLFIVSTFFYFKTSNLFFLLLLFSATNDFYVAKAIFNTKNTTKKKALLLYSVILNLGLLSYFKYAYFFTDSYNQIFHTDNHVFNYFAHWGNSLTGTNNFDVDNIVMPVGISYYTFRILSYTIDVYKGKLTPLNSLFDFAFYATFFPLVLIGPIVKARDFIPQMQKPFTLTKFQFGMALFMILNGLIKKCVFGDYISSNFIDRVYANPLLFSGVENILSVIAYSMQVYLDFSGYTDVATGIAMFLGFKFMPNFNSPYKAKNTAEFWKRWHISLSSWLQEYLYIPLGGNRKGTIGSYIIITILSIFIALLLDATWILWIIGSSAVVLAGISYFSPSTKNYINTNINLMITMLLGGLWHGATLNFIIWGGLNGLGLVVSKFWRKISPYEKMTSMPVHWWKVFNTFMFITITRIFFRAEDMNQANEVITKITTDVHWEILPAILNNFKEVFILLALSFIIHWLPEQVKWQYKKYFIKSPVWLKITFILITVIMIYQAMDSEMKPFIYFQF